MGNRLIIIALCMLVACKLSTQDRESTIHLNGNSKEYTHIGEIAPPDGYERINVQRGSFGDWLRAILLKKDKRVFLYNGSLKNNQAAQFAVLDMPVGKKDLQQCADAIMRLKAEYYFSRNMFDSISFHATDGTTLSFAEWRNGKRFRLSANKLSSYQASKTTNDARKDLELYLETVFSFAGTTSLARESTPVSNEGDILLGDIFIKPGFPGHAMIVIDVAANRRGEKMFMLAQGYMPAQDIHVVKNPENDDNNPWYNVSEIIQTPEWTFTSSQLKRMN